MNITGNRILKLILVVACICLLLPLHGCWLFQDPGLKTNPFKSYITYNLSTQNDTLKIGVDTLWLSCSFLNVFSDLSVKKNITYSDGLKLFIGINEVKFGLSPDPATDFGAYYQPLKFDFVPAIGEAEYTNTDCLIHPAFMNGTYSLKVGIVPKEAGLFFLEDGGGKPITTEVNMILYQSFNVADANIQLIPNSFPRVQKMVGNYINDPTFTVKNRAYCFYVKE